MFDINHLEQYRKNNCLEVKQAAGGLKSKHFVKMHGHRLIVLDESEITDEEIADDQMMNEEILNLCCFGEHMAVYATSLRRVVVFDF